MIKQRVLYHSALTASAVLLLAAFPRLSHGGIASEKAIARYRQTLKEIGLTEAQMDRIYYLEYDNYQTLTDEKVKKQAQWLREQGVKDVAKVVTGAPKILSSSIENNLQPKVEWLKQQGVKDVGAFISLNPTFLGLSLEENIKPKAEWIKQQGVKDVGKVISYFPQIFRYSITDNLEPKIEWLKNQGVKDIAKIISSAPMIFGMSIQDGLEPKVQWLKRFGVKDIGKILGAYPGILSYSIAENLEPKMIWLKNQYVEDIGKVISSYPQLFGQSIENGLEPKARWFEKQGVKDLGKLLESYPQVLGMSIEENLEPKVQWLNKQGITNAGELISRYPNFFGLSIEENLNPKMAEYREIWKMTTEELEKTPIYFGSSLKRVQELRDFLNEIAKMGGAESFDFNRLTEGQRRKLIQNLSVDNLMDYLKQIQAIDKSRNSLAELTGNERTLLGKLYKTNDLSKLFIWAKEFNKESKHVELTCLLGHIRQDLKIKGAHPE